MKAIVINRTDGGVSIMHAPDEVDVAEEVAKWQTGSNMVAASFVVTTPDQIPDRRLFRNAWRARTGRLARMIKGPIEIDMSAAREIHRDKMRDARAPLLAALDVDYQRADERKDEAAKAAVVSRKQALRDVTDDPRIEAAETPEALLAVWPDALPARGASK